MALTDHSTTDAQRTLPAEFSAVAAARGAAVALRWKHLGIWDNITWHTYSDAARDVGCAMLTFGVVRGDRVAVVSDTRPECLYVEFGAFGAGAIPVALSANHSARYLEHELHDCAPRILFVENEEQLHKALGLMVRLPALEQIVYLDGRGLHAFQHPMVLSLREFMQRGRQFHAANPARWDVEVRAAQADDVALIVYTAASTGPSRGVLLTHRNLFVQLDALQALVPAVDGDWQLSCLPMAYVLERCFYAYRQLTRDTVVHLGEGLPAVIENLREVSPQVVLAVPRVWERLHSVASMAIANATPFGQWGYRMALAAGARVADCRRNAQPIPAWLRLQHLLVRWTYQKRILGLIGLRRARCLVSGAAPISAELVRWYGALGLDMVEVYGLAEVTGYAATCGGAPPPQDVVTNARIRLGPDGEIQIHGQHVFGGYLNQPAQFAKAVDNGWLRTGDAGSVDATGALHVTGRLLDRFCLSDGTQVAPSTPEVRIKLSPYVSDAVVVGAGRSHLACLIMIDHDNVARFAQEKDIPFSNFASLARSPEVRRLIQAELDIANSEFASALKIRCFELIAVELTAADEILTPVLSLRRRVVLQRHGDLIEGMYTREGGSN